MRRDILGAIAGLLASALLLCVALALISWPARAQDSACARRDAAVKKLADEFGETLKSLGLHGDDAAIELYSSDETGTFSILVTRPDGTACMAISGDHWQDVKPIGPQGDPT